MNCTLCGQVIPSNAIFCVNCGKDITASQRASLFNNRTINSAYVRPQATPGQLLPESRVPTQRSNLDFRPLFERDNSKGRKANYDATWIPSNDKAGATEYQSMDESSTYNYGNRYGTHGVDTRRRCANCNYVLPSYTGGRGRCPNCNTELDPGFAYAHGAGG